MKRFSYFLKLTITGVLAFVFLIFPSTSYTQTTADSFGLEPVAEEINISTETTDLRVTIVRIINIFLGFLGLIAVLIVLYAGYLWMTAGGDDEQIITAKKLLINGVIGFAIIASAFLITSFILSRLQEAVDGGEGTGGDPTVEGSCSEPGTPYYELYHDTSRCNGFCSLYPLQCCTADNFVVKSITPHTPEATESTQMNNVAVRVLFSKQVAGEAQNIFKIYRREGGEDSDISGNFTFAFVEDGTIVEAQPTAGNIPNGEYVVQVNEGVRDTSGRILTTETSCGTFAKVGTFRTGDLGDAPVLDSTFGELDPVSINGNSGDDVYPVVQGQEYAIETSLRDDRGNAYAHLRIYKEGEVGTIFEDYIDGPRLALGSSKPFDFVYGIRITSKFNTGVVYVAEVVAHDIDGNVLSDSVRFRTVPPTCLNGVLDPGESSIDEGGDCGGGEGNSCSSQSDCAASLKCLDASNALCTAGSNSCMCKAVPYISTVEHMNGAPGNWITILGKHFGSTAGVVKFNYDFTGDGVVDSSVTASLAQCRVGQVWNNSWIIAEVPQQPEGTIVSPSISVTDANGLVDATNDNFGPNVGLFTYNTTQRPNLCSVTVASDRTITLDDGTVTTILAGSQSGPEGTPVVLEGKAFGGSQGTVTFGTADASISSWSGELVNSAVPFGGEGVVSAYVTSDNGEKSNPVPFTIASLNNLYPPTITTVDPPTTTKGSYITISGTRFGSGGTVYFTAIEGNSCPGAGCFLGARLPASCGNAWSDTQIIAKVPLDQEFVLGRYFITIQRNDGVNTLTSSGKATVDVVEGNPRPSICRIDPRRGFAPLSGSSVLTVYGENFLQNSQVKLWFPLGNRENPDSWLSTVAGVVEGGGTIVHTGPQKIETKIPYDLGSGLSMSSGPIKIKNGAGLFSNGVNYDVLDCREPSSPTLPGFECCSEGPDAGRWKQGGFACAGVSKEAGYVWRFTTGKTPKKFVVAEMCNAVELPSPSPSTLWDSGRNVCVNAQLQVRFNLPVDPATVTIPNISISTCGETNGLIDCDQSTSLNDNFTAVPGAFSVVLKPREANTPLSPNTWYRVGLKESISSLEVVTEFGVSTNKSNPLEDTRPCELNGESYAYCFDFKTGPSDFTCTLIGAGIEPPKHTTHLLGVVQDPRYNFVLDIGRIFTISNNLKPLPYFVYGKSNIACTSINVDTKPWVWGPSEPASATANHLNSYPNSYGYATAWRSNISGSEIHAKITENAEEIIATSTLIIDLGDPYAQSVWPSCIEACVNAEIGIEFSQQMNKGDFNNSHVTLHECENEDCTEFISNIALDITPASQNDTIFRAYPVDPNNPMNRGVLKKNTWYLVEMKDGIRSIGGIEDPGPPPTGIQFGNTATPKQWKFRTKNSDQLCQADSVRVQPDPFYSTFIGQTQLYKAFPMGSPDSCSPYGQQLNPWNFGWNWSTADPQIAAVSNFSFGGSPKSTCTIGCTPAGSDISKTKNTQYAADHPDASDYPACGNGTKDSGEDCDIAAPGEVPGKSCTFSCLRPGNLVKGIDPLQLHCGNGKIDTSVGEECDPKDPNGVPGYCTDTCTHKGSSAEQTGDPQIPICGSGDVTYGEDCDVSDPRTKYNCSTQCINLGTFIAQEWCDIQPNTIQSEWCQSAISICGNGVVEQGEECEADTDNVDNCSDQCVVQTACGTELEQCVLGSEGCLSDCTYAGSSVTYSTASVCGDGSLPEAPNSIGEYHGAGAGDVRSCEVSPGQAQNILGGNPVQIVTSVGATLGGQSTEVVSDLPTTVRAGTAQARGQDSAQPVLIPEVSGIADYHLQCGYSEFESATSTPYNNCPGNDTPDNANAFGVGLNSCCMRRPQRIDQYPTPNAGVGAGSAPICRNTYIEVVFDQEIPLQYLQQNIQLVQSYAEGYACGTHGGRDVTLDMRNLLVLEDVPSHNFFVRVWETIKNFLVRLIRIRALAETEPNISLPNSFVWCTMGTPVDVSATYTTSIDNVITHTIVSVNSTEVLQSNQYVVVLLNGGADGIRNSAGVSIKSPFGPELSDYWLFKTNNQVCKIKEVTVDPVSALYTTASSSKDFIAHAVSTNQDQLIVSTTEYAWAWSWGPTNDSIFAIPDVNTADNTISTKGVRGHTDGKVEARITRDVFETNNQLGVSFAAPFTLDALFCQKPWPASGVTMSEAVASTTAVFEDLKYNFSMYYCADSGTISLIDDLPYFQTIEVITDPEELGLTSSSDLPVALRRYLLFADKTEDVIGLQIFANSPKIDGSRQTLDEWYVEKFGDIDSVKKASVAGYEALVNEYNVYINAFNIDANSIYNNIYLFSIDINATAETKTVFQQLINSLRFNTNLTNYGRCLREGVLEGAAGVRETPEQFNSSLVCSTDFDCRESNGQPKAGSNGFCSNAATKFNRDIIRLEQMQTTEERTNEELDNDQTSQSSQLQLASVNLAQASQNSSLNFSSGTYIPGYTNSKWPSWGRLGSVLGGVPVDPVNRWVGCDGHDPATCWNVASTTYKCPLFAQTYEYSYDDTSDTYQYYVPFEFIRSSDTNFVSQYVDTEHVKFSRWCNPGSTYTPIGGQCGDGNINLGEDCDPPGRSVILSTNANGQTCAIGSYVTATCNSSCKYTYSACTAQTQICGNGRQEGSEECDAGSQNGQYGSRCTKSIEGVLGSGCKIATQTTGQYCGNNQLDQINGRYAEFCESVNGVCTFINNNGEIIRPEIHILLDNSGSMRGTNWTNAVAGVQTIYNQLAQNINLSLSIFSPVNTISPPTTCSKVISVTDLPSTPNTNTPTKSALEEIYASKDTLFGTDPRTPKKLLIITDGDPTDQNHRNQLNQLITACTGNTVQNTSSTIHKFFDAGISTYVVGFGTLSASLKNNLNIFATAGGTDSGNSSGSVIQKYFTAENSTQLVNAFKAIIACSEYSQFKQSSCAWNCQGYGEYCGDGIVQIQHDEDCDLGDQNGIGACTHYCKDPTVVPGPAVCGNNARESGEQCDDGNLVANDGCSATCTTESTAPRCGDGKVDPALPGKPAEQCDLSTQNGVVCTPGYETSCTYCTNNCTNVTIDPTAYCGNGMVDTDATTFISGQSVEACDYDSNNVYAFTLNSAGGLLIPNNKSPQVCPDKGSFACRNSCQLLENGCVSCTNQIVSSQPNNLPTPKISILNPMTQPDKSPFSHKEYVALYRKNPPGSTSLTFNYLGYRKLNYKSSAETEANYIDPFEPYFFITEQSGAWNPILNQGIQTNPACNGEYVMLYNKRDISRVKTGIEVGPGSLSEADIVNQGLADEFNYTVRGEGGQVVNEVVMSPAVAPDTVRIVTRWKKKSDASAVFMGEMYQDKAVQNTEDGNVFSYFKNFTPSFQGAPSVDVNCGEMIKAPNGYWVPFNPGSSGGPFRCRPTDSSGRIWMHKILDDAPTIAVQAITLSANNMSSSKPLGFYVTSPDGPVNQFIHGEWDYDLWVDIYTYHQGQIPEYSIYKPTYSFSVKNSIPSTDLGPLGARYWHVFNLIPTGVEPTKRFSVVPIGPTGAGTITEAYGGKVVQDTCRVRENMPNTTWCGGGGLVPFSGGVDIGSPADSLTVSPTTLNVGSASGSRSITVSSTVNWTVDETLSWLSLSTTTGSNNGTFTINYTANFLTNSQSGVITVTGGGITQTINITQGGRLPPQNSLTVSSNSVTLEAAQSSESTVTVNSSNVNWSLSGVPSGGGAWFTVSPTFGGNGITTLTFRATATNSSASSRPPVVVTVSGSGVPSLNISVTQLGTTPPAATLSVNPNPVRLASTNQSTGSASVISNNSWTLTGSIPSWLTVSRTTGPAGTTAITFTANSANTGTTEKTANFNFSYGGSTLLPFSVRQSAAVVTNYLRVDRKQISALSSSSGGTQVNIESNVDWDTVSSDISWLTVTPPDGSNNGRITISYTTNPDPVVRRGTITVSGGGITEVINVEQPAGAVVASLSVSSKSVTLAPNKRYLPSSQTALPYLVEVTSNVAWSISNVTYTSGGQGWFTATKGATGVSINYSTNTSGSERRGRIIVSAGDKSETIEVIQPAVQFTVASRVYALVATSTVELTVTSNVPWNVRENTPWITNVSPNGGTGNATIVISYNANTTQGNRDGVLTFDVADQTNYRQATVTQRYLYYTTSAPVENGYIKLSPLGGSITIPVFSDTNWGGMNVYTWYTINRSSSASTAGDPLLPAFGNGTLTINFDPLSEGESTRTGFFTIFTRKPNVDPNINEALYVIRIQLRQSK